MQKVKKKNWEKLLAAIVMTVAMLALNLFLQQDATAQSTMLWGEAGSGALEDGGVVSLEVQYDSRPLFEDSDIIWIPYETVSLAMKNATFSEPPLYYETKTNYKYGDFITSIYNIPLSGDDYWRVCVNGFAARRGIDTCILYPEDSVIIYNENVSTPDSETLCPWDIDEVYCGGEY